MSVTVEEQFGSPQVRKDSATRKYIISGTADEMAAEAALLAEAPTIYLYMPVQDYAVDPLTNDKWVGTVQYGVLAVALQDEAFEFDTTGGTKHITQSLGTIGAYAPAGYTAPDYGGAIGVNGEEVQGVDITVPAFKFSSHHIIENASANALVYRNLTGCVNNATFMGFAAGEVLFLGARGVEQQSPEWGVDFHFAAGANATNLIVGDITVLEKYAWDYLWVRYETEEDVAAGSIVKRPVAAYTERVYPWANFGLLGI
ncbi:MAG: hypothetical protein JXD22_11745 [Sedimentisphaerales bacterium]|nr:hypothetical protein [Sedimentisphaerales bacterium]